MKCFRGGTAAAKLTQSLNFSSRLKLSNMVFDVWIDQVI